MFKIAFENGHEAIGYTSGKMRRYRIRMAPGDKVKVELSPYDPRAAASSTASADRARRRMRWFNEDRGDGMIECDDGEPYQVLAADFVTAPPVGRCAGSK